MSTPRLLEHHGQTEGLLEHFWTIYRENGSPGTKGEVEYKGFSW